MAKMKEEAPISPAGPQPSGGLGGARVLIVGLVAVVVVLGLVLIIQAISQISSQRRAGTIDALANSTDECVVCHRRATPGIVEQFGHSTMADAKVACRDCHAVAANTPGAEEHEGTTILASPTPAKCQTCHQQEVAQFYQSRHSLPAYVAVVGSKGLAPAMMTMYQAIPEGQFAPDKAPNALYTIEGPDVTRFACEDCHGIGKPQPDGSVGECQKCHLRHEFSLEQVRKPETCNACHIGPDHPQWEIYQESPHGIAYATGGASWNWDADPGTLTARDFPAPTCAICHFSGFGPQGTTHDVGDRLSWFLFASTSTRRPAYQDNVVRMQSVCEQCHNSNWVKDFYAAADKTVAAVNAWVKQSDDITAALNAKGLLTSAPFDEPYDFQYYELWHDWGRTTKFGTWMQGPDYTQWHGAYEVVKALDQLKVMAAEKQAAATDPTPTATSQP